MPEDDIVIADPEGEYYPLVHRLGGQVVKGNAAANKDEAARLLND